jgi:hypothetical protein
MPLLYTGKLTFLIGRMEDICSPMRNMSLNTYKIYSIVVPIVLLSLILEAIYIIATIPGNISNFNFTVKKSLPTQPIAVTK